MPEDHVWHDLVMVASGFDDRHGVFLVPEGDEQARRQAIEHGWHTVVIDTEAVTDKDGFMGTVSDAFDLPPALVATWTGLDECLRAIDRDEPDGLLVLWDNWGRFAEADPEGFEYAVEVFQDACVAWHDDGFQGAVLLRGDGPDTDLRRW
jgi:hypothetical protein